MYRGVLEMEPLSKKSKLEVGTDTWAVSISPTQISFQSHHYSKLMPTTPAGENLRQYIFQILPTVTSCLHTRSCEVVVGLKLVKEDNSAIDASTQVGKPNDWVLINKAGYTA